MASQQLQSKKKCRQYSKEYLQFGFIHVPNKPQIPLCLICESTLVNDSMRPCKLKEHLENKHPSKIDKGLEYFKLLAERREKNTLATTRSNRPHIQHQAEAGLLASYNISLLIAKAGKAHSIGETLLIPVVHEVLKTVVQVDAPEQITRSILLSNNTVRRRMDEMAADVE